MRRLLLLLIVLSITPPIILAQTSWSYGITPAFHVGSIKPTAKDTFTGRASFGLSAFILRNGLNWSQSLGFGSYQNRWINNNSNQIDVYNGLGLELDFIRHLSEQSKTSLRFGLRPNAVISRRLLTIDGTKGQGVSNQAEKSPFDYDLGLKVGAAFMLTNGMDLQLNYVEFVKSKQTKNSVGPMGDLFQVAIEIRLNELKAKENRNEHYKTLLNDISKSHMVFVLPISEMIKFHAEEASEFEKIKNNMLDNIDSSYSFSEFIVIADTALSDFLGGDRNNILKGSTKNLSQYYIAKLGNGFTSGNSSIKRGVFLYDSQMKLVKLSSFTSYRSLNSNWSDLNASLRVFKDFNRQLFQNYGYY